MHNFKKMLEMSNVFPKSFPNWHRFAASTCFVKAFYKKKWKKPAVTMLSPHPNHQDHPSISALLCEPQVSTSAVCDPCEQWMGLRNQSAERHSDALFPTGEGINHPDEWGCLFSWDHAYWSECRCIEPCSNSVRMPSRDSGWQSVMESIKRNRSPAWE